jgi:hypothetical protein
MIQATFKTLKLALAAALLVPAFSFSAHAQEEQQDQFDQQTYSVDAMARKSCRARAIDRYYCPSFGGQWWGPYFDNGCSVKCEQGQKAVCREATCEEGQTGRPVESSCTCQ